MSYILRDADFVQTPAKNLVLDRRSAGPDHAVEGQVIFNTTDKEAQVYKDGAWAAMGGGGGAPIGAVFMWLMANAPDGYLKLDGSTPLIADYPLLFALWGTAYGGNGTTTFGLPDWREYSPVGMSAAAPYNVLNAAIGAKTSTGLVAHTHAINHDHASFTSGSEAAHTHAINHDHASVTSGSGGVAHTHSITHDHGAFTSGSQSASHTHTVSGTTGSAGEHAHSARYRQSAAAAGTNLIFLRRNEPGDGYDGTDSDAAISAGAHTHSFSATSATQSASHTHSCDPPNFSGTSGAASATSHTHAVDLPALTGASGAGASHTHAVDVPAYTGNSGFAGDASVSILDPKRVCHFIVRGK